MIYRYKYQYQHSFKQKQRVNTHHRLLSDYIAREQHSNTFLSSDTDTKIHMVYQNSKQKNKKKNNFYTNIVKKRETYTDKHKSNLSLSPLVQATLPHLTK